MQPLQPTTYAIISAIEYVVAARTAVSDMDEFLSNYGGDLEPHVAQKMYADAQVYVANALESLDFAIEIADADTGTYEPPFDYIAWQCKD